MIDVSHTEIPKRLDRIVKILADEQSNIEKDINRKTTRATLRSNRDLHLPPTLHLIVCMEYFLKNNIMGGMYDIGQLNFPSGIFLEITRTFSLLVTELDRRFLVHSSVHIPILKLLKTAMFSNELSASTEKEIVHLMFTVCCRLLEYPDLVSIFFHERKFLGVSPSGTVELRLRTSSDPNSRNNNEVRVHEFQVSENSEFDYPLFLYLLHFVHYEGQTGDYARTALIFCLQTATPMVDTFILRYSGFSQIMVTALGGRFSSLSAQYVGSDAEESLTRFLTSLEFFQKAVVEASPSVSMDLVESFKLYFLVRIVHPKMTGGDTMNQEISATTIYVDRMLQLITEEKLARYFVELLVTDSMETMHSKPSRPSSPSPGDHPRSQQLEDLSAGSSEDAQIRKKGLAPQLKIATALPHLDEVAPIDSPVFSFGSGLTQPLSDLVPALVPIAKRSSASLIQHRKAPAATSHEPITRVLLLRLNHPNAAVQEATWQLYHTMVSQHRALAVPRLLRNTFEMLNTADVQEKSEKMHAEEIKKFFEIFPTPQTVHDYEVMGYEFYLQDVQEIVAPTQGRGQKKAAEAAPPASGKKGKGKGKAAEANGHLLPIAPDRISVSGRGSPTPSGRKSPTGRRSPMPPAGEGQSSSSATPAFVDPLSQEVTKEGGDSSEPDEFLEIVLARLETFTTNTFESNLTITGIFTQLACFPDPRLTEFILHSDNLHKRYLLSLHSILSRVSQEMIKSLQRFFLFVFIFFWMIEDLICCLKL